MKPIHRALCLLVVAPLATVTVALNQPFAHRAADASHGVSGAVAADHASRHDVVTTPDRDVSRPPRTGADGGSVPHISDVRVSPPFFNPTVGQSAEIAFDAGVAGIAAVSILDRDRFVVRRLPPASVQTGRVSFVWDGRDDDAVVVPDEAWNVRIELEGETYDPSLDFTPVSEDPQPRTYSRIGGVLSYRLARPSRVHIQAGQATHNPRIGRSEGPILKTIVNREPRSAGAVVEMWNGFDESGTIRVSDLPNFAVSVLATSLPDSSLITRGNRREPFLDYARRQRPAEALRPKKRSMPTHHHVGLNAFEDISPALRLAHRRTDGGDMRLELRIEGASAEHFLRQEMNMSVYVDEKRVLTPRPRSSPMVVTIPARSLPPGQRRITVNWGSEYGPTAVGALRLDIPATQSARAGAER